MKTLEGKWYDYAAGGYCGVYMPESVMKRLVKLQAEYTRKSRAILEDHKEELRPSHWTMGTTRKENGDIDKAEYVHFTLIDDTSSVDSRIRLFQLPKPKYMPEVLEVKSYEEAKEVAENRVRGE